MKSMMIAAVLAGVVGAACVWGQANTPVAVPGAPVTAAGATLNVVAPVKAYVKTDEAVMIRFLETKSDETKKAYDALGLAAAKVPGSFTPAAAGDIVDASGKPVFTLYDFADGKPVAAKQVKMEAVQGQADLTASYPQIAEGGTYVLVWKNATPLVINSLNAPGRSKRQLAEAEAQIKALPAEQQKMVRSQFLPNVIHITPLEYGVIKTPAGEMKATFYYDVAPHTIDNWIGLAKDGYFDGSAFHRIIKGFMIQGGDSLANTDRAGTGGPGYHINAEFNDKPHEKGVLSMARSSDPDSAGSQFFVMHAKTPHLDGQYTAFGKVFEGLEVVDKLAATPAEEGSGAVKGAKPKIESVRILPATWEMYGGKK